MNTKKHLKSTLTSAAAIALFASSTQLSAYDYRLWREQVPLYQNESRTVDLSTGEQGSWFLREILTNHLDRAKVESVRDRIGTQTSASSIRNNWFLHAITAPNYSGEAERDAVDVTPGKLALGK